jgi:hypothetical protein
MRQPHKAVILSMTWTLFLNGCQGDKGFRWDWWKKQETPKAKETAKAPYTPGPDDDLLKGPASRPTSTQSTTRPVTRRDWAAARPASQPGKTTSRRADGTSIETPILFVNDDVITVKEVLDPLREEMTAKTRELAPSEYRRYMGQRLMTQVVHLIDEILAYGEVKKEVTEDMENAIKKAVDQTERNRINAEFGGRFSRYEAWLESNGESREDVRKRIRRRILVQRYLQDKFLPLVRAPNRQELWKYYEKHPDEFTEPLRVEMFLIDVPYWAFLEGTPSDDRQTMWPKVSGPRRLEARRAAQRHMDLAVQEIKSGIPFESVAQSYSKGPNSAKGGAWGTISPGGLTGRWAEAAEALFQLKTGQVGDVVRTDDGLFLVKAGQRSERRVIPFIDAQTLIEKRLVKEQQDRLESDFLNKLRSKATLGDVPSFLKAVYDAAPKQAGDQYDYKLGTSGR